MDQKYQDEIDKNCSLNPPVLGNLFSELVSVQDKQRFALLSFTVDKLCHIGVHCIGAMCVMMSLRCVSLSKFSQF